jgi:hypothetical protein
MRSIKGSHRIVVNGVEYRWRAKGDDGCIGIGIWPSNNIGPYIGCAIGYHETSAEGQIVVTNRIIRRVIEFAIARHGYDPHTNNPMLGLVSLEDVIRWDDAVRACKD